MNSTPPANLPATPTPLATPSPTLDMIEPGAEHFASVIGRALDRSQPEPTDPAPNVPAEPGSMIGQSAHPVVTTETINLFNADLCASAMVPNATQPALPQSQQRTSEIPPENKTAEALTPQSSDTAGPAAIHGNPGTQNRPESRNPLLGQLPNSNPAEPAQRANPNPPQQPNGPLPQYAAHNLSPRKPGVALVRTPEPVAQLASVSGSTQPQMIASGDPKTVASPAEAGGLKPADHKQSERAVHFHAAPTSAKTPWQSPESLVSRLENTRPLSDFAWNPLPAVAPGNSTPVESLPGTVETISPMHSDRARALRAPLGTVLNSPDITESKGQRQSGTGRDNLPAMHQHGIHFAGAAPSPPSLASAEKSVQPAEMRPDGLRVSATQPQQQHTLEKLASRNLWPSEDSGLRSNVVSAAVQHDITIGAAQSRVVHERLPGPQARTLFPAAAESNSNLSEPARAEALRHVGAAQQTVVSPLQTKATHPEAASPLTPPVSAAVTEAATPAMSTAISPADRSGDAIPKHAVSSTPQVAPPERSVNVVRSDVPAGLPGANNTATSTIVPQSVPSAGSSFVPSHQTTASPEAIGKNPPPSRGTSGAQGPVQMKMAENMNETVERTEQKLPEKAVLARAEASRTEPALESVPTDLETSPAAPTPMAMAGPLPAQLRAVERAEALIALHAMRLHESGNESLQVVIKPGPDLHLTLNLNMRDGAIEVQAQLHRGDFDLLNRHWSQLQEQLEQRGVRLAPLAQNESGSAASHFSQHSRRERNDQETSRTGAFAEFVIPSTLVPKPAQLRLARHGWESWA